MPFISRVRNFNFQEVFFSNNCFKVKFFNLLLCWWKTLSNKSYINWFRISDLTFNFREVNFTFLNSWMEWDLEYKIFLLRNYSLFWLNSEILITEVSCPIKSGWYISNITNYKFFRKFGIYSDSTKVNLIKRTFEVNTVAATCYSTKLSNFSIIYYFIV